MRDYPLYEIHYESKHYKSYFIQFNGYLYDKDIARCVRLTILGYRTIMKEQFNSISETWQEVSFKTKEDAEKACEWLESLLLLREMRES